MKEIHFMLVVIFAALTFAVVLLAQIRDRLKSIDNRIAGVIRPVDGKPSIEVEARGMGR
jgi:hypothetical protein